VLTLKIAPAGSAMTASRETAESNGPWTIAPPSSTAPTGCPGSPPT
jgi:hypothetical protein